MKVSPVDLNLLAVLDAILGTASVSRAADQVGISKPAMSHALARLRVQMNDPILVRAGQEWRLSERALALRDHVRDLAAGVKAVLDPQRTFDPATTTRAFTIHATDHVLALLGTSIGGALAREAPNATLRFLSISADDSGGLRDGRVDLALGVFPDLPPEFRTQALFQERFACVVRKGHPMVKGPLTLKCFLALKHVLVAPRGLEGSPVDTALAERGLTRKVTRFVPYFVVAMDLVSRSNCIVTISERLANAYAERLKLQVLRPPLALPAYTISQVWHPRIGSDPGHQWLRARVLETAAELSGKAVRAKARVP
jgi:DNA-binding transcriptional LysR family regulator